MLISLTEQTVGHRVMMLRKQMNTAKISWDCGIFILFLFISTAIFN